MPVIQHEQGSQAWLDYRKSKIMATDIPIILGSNPWKTPLELWEEKLGFSPPTQLNEAMERGQRLEPEARKLASELIGIDFQPCVFQSENYPWLACSLDGISPCGKYILEIKCPKEFIHCDAINQIYPSYYCDQIQTQLLVNKSMICYYFSYRPEYKEQQYALVETYPDFEKYADIAEFGYQFYTLMCTMNPPKQKKIILRK